MSLDNTNIWSIAEAYVAGTISDTDRAALLQHLQTDTTFAAEFHESVDMIRSLAGSGQQKRFRSTLRQVAAEYNAKHTATKIIPMQTNYWKVVGIAAGIALLASFGTYMAVMPGKKNAAEYNNLSRKVENLERSTGRIISDIKNIKNTSNTPVAEVSSTGTGFAITNNGYIATNYHVIDGNDSIYIQNRDGKYFKATVKAFDLANDIAILKVENKNFRFGKTEVPYTLATDKSGLAARIYTLGFPKDELVYNEGYISGRNGFESDTNQYRLDLPTEHGQSGSPVLDEKGNVLAMVTANGSNNTYAVSSCALLKLIESSLPDLDLPSANRLRRLTREQQIQKLEFYTCSVKVYKK